MQNFDVAMKNKEGESEYDKDTFSGGFPDGCVQG